MNDTARTAGFLDSGAKPGYRSRVIISIPGMRISRRWSTLTTAATAMLAAGLMLTSAPAEAAKCKDSKKIFEAYKEGLDYYSDLELEEAKDSLKRALKIATAGKCRSKTVAKAHIRLGAIFKLGDDDEALALREFKRAVEIDPSVELDSDIAVPDLDTLLDEAKAGAGDYGDDDDGDDDDDSSSGGGAAEEKDLSCRAVKGEDTASCVDRGTELKVQCESATDLMEATLYFRVDGGPWVPNEMVGAGGFFGTTVSASVVKGKKIEFYVDAKNDAGAKVAYGGTDTKPYTVAIGCDIRLPDPPGDDDDDLGLDDEDDPLDDDDDDGGRRPKKPKKPKKPGKKGRRIISAFVLLGTGFGLAGEWTQINGLRAGIDNGNGSFSRGFAVSPFFLMPEIAVHPIPDLSLGVYARIGLSPIFTTQYGLRARYFIGLGKDDKLTLMPSIFGAFGVTCSVQTGVEGTGCRGGVAHLIATPDGSVTTIDYTLVGPHAVGAGFSGMFNITPNVGIYFGLDLAALFGRAGFSTCESADPRGPEECPAVGVTAIAPPAAGVEIELVVGARFGN